MFSGSPDQLAAWKQYETTLVTGRIPQVLFKEFIQDQDPSYFHITLFC